MQLKCSRQDRRVRKTQLRAGVAEIANRARKLRLARDADKTVMLCRNPRGLPGFSHFLERSTPVLPK
jgi:hypothetical protein